MSEAFWTNPLPNTSFEIATSRDTGFAFVQAISHLHKLKNKIFNLGGGKECRTTFEKFIVKTFEISGLGKLNFPEFAFAEKNFHCGFYEDGDNLEEIINFRRDTINDYFSNFKKSINPFQRFFTIIFRSIIKKILLKKSEPLKAMETNDTVLIQRFFA